MPDLRVDLNADMGESFGAWSFGVDDDLIDVVSSSNVACGFHAGDPAVMRRTVRMARDRRVALGAHVSYPDLQGFGRRPMEFAPADLIDIVVYQMGALDAFARIEGIRLGYVKPHGALYNVAAVDSRVAGAVVEAVAGYDSGMAVMTLPGSVLAQQCNEAGIRVISEAFADRAYMQDGTLAPRSMPGSVIEDPDVVAARVVRLVTLRTVETIDGHVLDIHPDSICIHSDSPGAVSMARAIKGALDEAGIRIASFDAATPA